MSLPLFIRQLTGRGLLATGALLAAHTAQAQLNYRPANAQSTVTTYADLGKNATAVTMANTDDANSAPQSIGFTFSFNGQSFTQFVMNTNGFIRLGAAAPSTAALYPTYAQSPTDGAAPSASAADVNLLMPFNTDLTAGTGTPDYRVRTSGSAGSRVCTIQWKNVSDKAALTGFGGTLQPSQLTNMAFQIRLYEGSNIVEFVYDEATPGTTPQPRFVDVGIKGGTGSAGNVVLAQKASPTLWSGTVFLDSYAALASGNHHNVRGLLTAGGAYAGPDAGRTYRFAPDVANDAAVTAIYTLGRLPLALAAPHVVQTVITNQGTGTYGGGTATLTITGPAGNAFTNTQTVPALAVGASATIAFAGYTPAVVGTNTVRVTLSNDGNVGNNTQTELQEVNRTTIGYASPNEVANSSVGLTSSNGILAVRYTATSALTVGAINVQIGVDNVNNAHVGQPVRAVLLNSAGTIVGSSALYTIQSTDPGKFKAFTLSAPVALPAGDFYVGLSVTPRADGANFYPVATAAEFPGRPATFYTAASDGSGLADQSSLSLGIYLIEAVTTNQPPFCGQVTNLTLLNRTDVTATLSFMGTSAAPTSTYTVTLIPSGGGAVVSRTVSAAPVTMTGLTPGVTYTASVVTNCGGTPSSTSLGTTTSISTLANLVVSTPQTVSGSYYNVTVQDGGSVTLGGDLTVYGLMTVQNGGTLRTDAPSYYVRGPGRLVLDAGATLLEATAPGVANSVSAGFQLTGSPALTLSSDADYQFTGTTAQLTGPLLPAQVRNLTVNNGAGVTLTKNLQVAQVLRLTSGNFTLNGKSLLLPSTTAGTALVDNTGGQVLGATASMQRLITNTTVTGPAYRHLSSPVASIAFDSLRTGGSSPVFNSAYNNSATPGLVTPFPTVFGYDQGRISTVASNYSAFDRGWFTPANSSSRMAVGQGYTVNAPIGATPFRFTGTLNTGAQNSGTLSWGTDPAGGWQLLGNPYPSPLDWSTVTVSQRPGVGGAMYIYQSSGQYAGNYRSYQNGLGASPVIEAGAAYFVRMQLPVSNGAVNLTNANRVTTYGNPQPVGRGPADLRPRLQLQLRGANLADDLYVYLQIGATAGVDAEFDARKLANPTGLNLSTVVGTDLLAIDGRPLLTTNTVVPLHVSVPTAGTYALTAAELLHFTSAVYLFDAATNTTIDLSRQPSYSFSTAATTMVGRFSLQLRPAAPLAAASLAAAGVSIFPNPAHENFTVQLSAVAGAGAVQAELLNPLGQVVRRQTAALPASGVALTVPTVDLPVGVYTLRLQAGTSTLIKKVVIR